MHVTDDIQISEKMFNQRAKQSTHFFTICLSACACLHVLWVPITWIGAWWHSCWVRFGIYRAVVNTSIPQSNACACFRHEKFILRAVGESKCSYGLKSVPYLKSVELPPKSHAQIISDYLSTEITLNLASPPCLFVSVALEMDRQNNVSLSLCLFFFVSIYVIELHHHVR